ncbi:hypothetical protein N9515_04830 [Vicingaceae bacterium]|nr:hypothetical protein [Vicingaceae bacterium]|tara:strand:+ start:17616 stop:18059 length:444 start_codon:yes stop_codon:yes gene_type:complete
MLDKSRKFFKWGLSTFGVALFYILVVLLVGEIHPFSRFPMYSSFPNWSYSFYLTDETDKIVPFSKLKTFGSSVGHLYGSVANELNIPYGNFSESKEELKQIGDRMIYVLIDSNELEANYIKLNLKGFYYQNDSIQELSVLMTSYENY